MGGIIAWMTAGLLAGMLDLLYICPGAASIKILGCDVL
jgi:hypothetical protein